MFIDINTLGPEGLAFDRSLRLRQLEGPSRERVPEIEARLCGSIVPDAAGAGLTARVEATVPLQCSRCLEVFPWSVRSEVSLEVVREAPADAGSGTDEASILVAPEGKIGLEDLATEQLYLNLPLKPICSPSCRGLCPSCGINRNTGSCTCEAEPADPRLAPLLLFRKKMDESERS
jgi:uncharacterized protein